MRIFVALGALAVTVVVWFGLTTRASSPLAVSNIPAGTEVPGNQLPEEQVRRTFAKPLALDTSSLLFFQRDGEKAVVWRIDWKTQKVSSFPVPELKLQKDRRYTALSSQEGLWLLGDTSVLVRPDGRRLVLETKFNEPVAVALDDQSVLVLGPSLHGTGQGDQNRMQQLSLHSNARQLLLADRGLLSYDGRPNETGKTYRAPRYGHSAVKLRDGRVMMLGGDVTRTFASLIEGRPQSDAWSVKPVASMPNERTFGAALVLPDGRVVVTGAPHLRCYGEANKVRSVDVYDVQTNRWSSLPPLPFVPCADSYGADVPSITATPNGSIVIGGYLEPQIMLLPRDANSPTGYAGTWQVHGRMPFRRISGVVQALSDQEVVVAGGVDNLEKHFGGCCHAITGFDRIAIDPVESKESLAMSFVGAGVAKRGRWVFAGSGRRFGFTSSGQMRYSAYAELVDVTSGKVRQLPNIPFASGAAKAVWLDDDRVLLKGIRQGNDRGFELSDNLSSYVPSSSGAMAIFHVKDSRWSEPIVTPELESAQLVTAEGNSALLLSATQQLLRLDLETRKAELLQHAQRGRQGGVARLLPHGKLVLAGGEVQSETVSVLDPDCEAAPGNECPERFAGFGPYSRLAMIEVMSLEKALESGVSELSVTGPSGVASTVITAKGQAIVLAQDQYEKETSIARSSASGKSWDSLPLPGDLKRDGHDHGCGRCVLALAPDPRTPGKELFFFRQGAIDADYIDDQIGEQSANVWWWNDAELKWHHVLHTAGVAARSSPLALGEPLSPNQGKRMMSMGWHLPEPVLWMEP